MDINMKEKVKSTLLVVAFMVFYLVCFSYLENRTGVKIHYLQINLDYRIPFCEYFIIPYLLWFPYVAVTVLYFLYFNKTRGEFYQLAVSLGIGMTLFLLISYVFPNGQQLRPYSFPRDNVFTDMVIALYKTDTSTNVMPSIHVFNSMACCYAIWESKSLKNNWIVRIAAWILTVLIILATMFLKQHTILDVAAGLLLGKICWFFMYRFKAQRETALEYERIKK